MSTSPGWGGGSHDLWLASPNFRASAPTLAGRLCMQAVEHKHNVLSWMRRRDGSSFVQVDQNPVRFWNVEMRTLSPPPPPPNHPMKVRLKVLSDPLR